MSSEEDEMYPQENLQHANSLKTDGNRDAFETYVNSTLGGDSLLKTLRCAPEPFHENGNVKLASAPEICFEIEDTNQKVVFQGQGLITIGRKDSLNKVFPAFDLNAYDGAILGVSRRHAKLSFHQGRYCLMDLGSSNGTRINGKKLHPQQMTPIYDGDVISFGNLNIMVSL